MRVANSAEVAHKNRRRRAFRRLCAVVPGALLAPLLVLGARWSPFIATVASGRAVSLHAPQRIVSTDSTRATRVGFSSGNQLLNEQAEDLHHDIAIVAASGARWLRVNFSRANMQPGRD